MAAAISPMISSTNPQVPSATIQVVSATKVGQTLRNMQTQAALKPDTVKLSFAGQVKLLHRQGLSASVIASRLGSSVKNVDQYLSASTTKATAPAAVVPSVGSGQLSSQPVAPPGESTQPASAQPKTPVGVATKSTPAATPPSTVTD